jgi:hypothetical protein
MVSVGVRVYHLEVWLTVAEFVQQVVHALLLSAFRSLQASVALYTTG